MVLLVQEQEEGGRRGGCGGCEGWGGGFRLSMLAGDASSWRPRPSVSLPLFNTECVREREREACGCSVLSRGLRSSERAGETRRKEQTQRIAAIVTK